MRIRQRIHDSTSLPFYKGGLSCPYLSFRLIIIFSFGTRGSGRLTSSIFPYGEKMFLRSSSVTPYTRLRTKRRPVLRILDSAADGFEAEGCSVSEGSVAGGVAGVVSGCLTGASSSEVTDISFSECSIL